MEEHEDAKRYERLIFRESHRLMRRLTAAGARNVTFEDVVQEMWIGWMTASRTFDPAQGVPFMPYLINGLRLHSKTIMRGYISRHPAHFVSFDQDNSQDGEDLTLHDVIPSDVPTAAEVSFQRKMLDFALTKLSARAATFLRILADAPPELSEQVRRRQVKAKFGRDMGINVATPNNISSDLIFDLMGAERKERTAIMAEVRKLGDKICRR